MYISRPGKSLRNDDSGNPEGNWILNWFRIENQKISASRNLDIKYSRNLNKNICEIRNWQRWYNRHDDTCKQLSVCDVVQAFAAYIPASVSLSTCSIVLQYFQRFFWSLLVIVITVVTIIASLWKSYFFQQELTCIDEMSMCLKYNFCNGWPAHSSYHNYQWGRPFTI